MKNWESESGISLTRNSDDCASPLPPPADSITTTTGSMAMAAIDKGLVVTELVTPQNGSIRAETVTWWWWWRGRWK